MNRQLLDHYLKLLEYDKRPEFINKYLEVPCLKRLKKVGYFCRNGLCIKRYI